MKNSDYREIEKEIGRLEKEISGYPVGSISKKNINGKQRYYHQWYELGKTKSKYIKDEDVEKLDREIGLRRKAQARLKSLKEKLRLADGEKGSVFSKKLKASIDIPIEVTGLFNGRYIIPDKILRPTQGQKVLVTIRGVKRDASEINLDKYVNQGEKLFATDAQEYVRGLRDEERM